MCRTIVRHKTRSKKFRLIPVRSPLLGESKRSNRGREFVRRRGGLLRCPRLPHCIFLSFPPVTKMFQFTGSSSHPPMYSASGRADCIGAGFPIRRSPGQRLLATSPKLIAGCYVLHRLFMSRHSPYTLIEIFPHF